MRTNDYNYIIILFFINKKKNNNLRTETCLMTFGNRCIGIREMHLNGSPKKILGKKKLNYPRVKKFVSNYLLGRLITSSLLLYICAIKTRDI